MTQAEIGNAIANARKEQGITIRRMAEMAGLTPRAVQAVEKGYALARLQGTDVPTCTQRA